MKKKVPIFTTNTFFINIAGRCSPVSVQSNSKLSLHVKTITHMISKIKFTRAAQTEKADSYVQKTRFVIPKSIWV